MYKNRPVHANLYLLFACTHDYKMALTRLSQVVEFFQGKHVFTDRDGLELSNGLEEDDLQPFRIIMELENLTLEQINYMWGFLGGKQLPSVVYRARLILLEAKEKQSGEGPPIQEIQIDGSTTV